MLIHTTVPMIFPKYQETSDRSHNCVRFQRLTTTLLEAAAAIMTDSNVMMEADDPRSMSSMKTRPRRICSISVGLRQLPAELAGSRFVVCLALASKRYVS